MVFNTACMQVYIVGVNLEVGLIAGLRGVNLEVGLIAGLRGVNLEAVGGTTLSRYVVNYLLCCRYVVQQSRLCCTAERAMLYNRAGYFVQQSR